MNAPPSCPKCGKPMEEGHVVDRSDSGYVVSAWISGSPERGIFGGLKTMGKDQIEIRTFRCVECGYLESYANK